jgi:sirohydrochlorin ferrochelatase
VSTGIVVFAHGSRIESANESVRLAAAELARAGGYPLVEPAFLELGEPDLEGAVAKLVEAGAARIVVIPYFLTIGMHLERDLPRIVACISEKNKGIEITTTAPLEGHPGLVEAMLARARQET